MHQLVDARAQDQAQAIAALLDMQIVRLQEELTDLVHGMEPDAVLPATALFPGGLALYDAQDQPTTVGQAPWATAPGLAAFLRRARSGSTGILRYEPTNTVQPPLLLLLAATGHDGSLLVGALPIDPLVEASVASVGSLEPSDQLSVLNGDETIVRLGQGTLWA